MNDLFSSVEEGLYAAPYDKNFKTIPVKNERVDIIKTTTGYVYRRNSATLSPYTDGVGDTLAKVFRTVKGESSNDASSYNSTSNTGIANKTDSGDDETSGFGEYFEAEQNESIHQLKLFEGDTVIQSRFGQSIRFSGYNNSERKLHPSIIIRNRENNNSQNELGLAEHIEEDINKDVKKVPPGQILCYNVKERRFGLNDTLWGGSKWNLDMDLKWDPEEFDDKVKRCFQEVYFPGPKVNKTVSLSGGLDSTLILSVLRPHRLSATSCSWEDDGTVDDQDNVFMIKESELAESCLLYTSPSPRDRTRSRMPSSA